MIKNGVLISFLFLLSACTLSPEPMTMNEHYGEAKKNLKTLFAHQNNTERNLDYYHALALGLKYNLDYRIKLANNALEKNQLSLAEFAMFPALNTSASLYTRNNDLASFGTTIDGSTTGVLISTPRTLRSTRIGMSWNILDFGLSYVRAKQQGDRYLIAQEEARKQLQQLAQDILRSYWEAYSAQQLMEQTKEFKVLLTRANNQLNAAIADKTIPKENVLKFQEALLNGDRNLVQLKYKYDKAMFDLKHILNLPLDRQYRLAAPPQAFIRKQNLKQLDFRKVDSITLVKRPELRGQSYQRRIAKSGIQTAILQALPGVTLNPGWNYNSNKFLLNNAWMDKSVDVAWNLLNLASLPSALDSAEAQIKYEKLKLMALTLTVLTETRYAYSRYQNLLNEYKIVHEQTENANAMYRLIRNRERASLASSQESILAKLKTITTKMDENLLQSDLSTSLGELYLSTGFDILPYELTNMPVPEIVKRIKSRFATDKTMDFTAYVNGTYKKIFRAKTTLAKK